MFEKIKRKIKIIFKLALPMMASSVAIGMMGVVDTIVVGHYDTDQLAYMGLANSVFIILFTIPLALLQGVIIKASQKFGARKFHSTGKIYNEGKKYAIPLFVVFFLIGMTGPHFLHLLGQSGAMEVEGGKLLRILSCSIPFILLNVTDVFFLQSIKRPHIAMYSAVTANILNLILNPILVFGMFGAPEMGAAGAAVTTVILRIFMALFTFTYILRMKKNPKLNKRFGLHRSYDTWWMDSKNTRKIGYGIAVMTMATHGSYAISNNFAGWMGEQPMAIFVVMSTIGGILFMLFFSLSQATSIVVANDFGRKDKEGIVVSTLGGLVMLSSAIMLCTVVLGGFHRQIFSWFTNDEAVILGASILIGYMIFEIIVDSIPLNIIGSLNGRSDVKIPTINQVISFVVVKLSTSYLFAFTFNMGVKGLILGSAIAGISSLTLNGARFMYLIRRDRIEGLR